MGSRLREIVIASALAGLAVGPCLLSTASAQTGACLPTGARVVAPHSFKGLVPRPRTHAYTDLAQLITADGTSLNDPFYQRLYQRLQSEGFVSGIFQFYNPPKHRKHRGWRGQAISDTLQLRDPTQAAAEASAAYQGALSEAKWKRFTVPQIPGSTGLLQPATRKFTGASNVYFSDGPYSYLIGESAPKGSGYATVVRAAIRLYGRVHGQPACP